LISSGSLRSWTAIIALISLACGIGGPGARICSGLGSGLAARLVGPLALIASAAALIAAAASLVTAA
jgi:hypothetical protein